MPLSASERTHLKKRLNDERERVLRDLAEFARSEAEDRSDEPNAESSIYPANPDDLGTDASEEEVDAAISMRQSAELQQIDDAIERITNTPELYGICENTGAEIPFARLDIIPWARTTVESATP